MKKKLYSFLFAAFLATTSLLAAGDATSGLRMQYSFESVDTVESVPYILDQTPNHLNGKVLGKIALTAGYPTGKSLPLTDTTNCVEVPGNIFEGVTDFTWSFWLNQNAMTQWARIFDLGSSQSHYMFLTMDQEVLRFEMNVDYDTAPLTYMSATEKLPLKRWNHVAIVGKYTNISSEDTTSTVSIYLNGKLCGTSTAFKLAPYMLGNALTHPRIGDSQYPDPTLNGYIDDFRFYNRALSVEDLEAVSGISAELKAAYNTLDIPLESRTDIKYPNTLTLPSTFGGMNVTWTTSDSTVITKNGVPLHSEISRTDATLTAKITAPDGYTNLEKQFLVTVYPTGEPVEILADYKFATEDIFHRNDSLFVKDEGQLKLEAFTVGGAQIIPIGDVTGTEGLDYFNVYASNNAATTSANKQWLDLGQTIGTYVYKLRDHSVSIFYRRDTTIDHKTWSDYGQLLYAFGNSDNLGNNAYGGMYFEPKRARVTITPGNWNQEKTGYYIEGGEPGTNKKPTPLGNVWHNVTYTQQNGIGNLLFDGVLMVSGAMPAPKEQLTSNSNVKTRTGTWYNRLGGALYSDNITAKNTMLYGFKMLSYGMKPDEADDAFFITPTIELLNEATAKTTWDVNAYLNLMPALKDARSTLAIKFLTDIHDELQAAYDIALVDSANRTATTAKLNALLNTIKLYKEYSADWVKMKGVLASFDDERALNYPGLPELEKAIATVQTAYNNYEIETTMFADLDTAVLNYQKSQIATSTTAANYTFMIKNPSFEQGTGGTKLAGSGTNGAFELPLGWNLYVPTKNVWVGCKHQTAGPSDGAKDYEVWTGTAKDIYAVDLSQTIAENLPAGWYVLSADVRSQGNSKGGHRIYATTWKDTVTYKSDTLEADKPGIRWYGGYNDSQLSYKKLFVKFKSKGEKVTIGLHVDSAVMKVDNFNLAYYGPSDNEPTLGDRSSLIKNASFEAGARTTELDGVTADTTIKATSGDIFAPLDWKITAAAKAPVAQNATFNVIASGDAEGSYLYKIKADTLTSAKLYQTIYAPSTGMYKLNAFLRADSACRSDARLFAQVGRRSDEGKKLMTAVDTSLTFKGWKKMEFTFRAAVANQIDLGIMTSGNVDVDGFKLEQYSNVFVGIKGEKSGSANSLKPYTKDGVIYINGLSANDRVSVYDIAGRQISVKNPSQIKVSKGMYMIKINNEVYKQLVK